jgi:glycosyltransferase involved in cell wall biosynthesis
MKRALMISYYFPPLGGVGSYRVLKFVKYLRKFGWEIAVLTVKDSLYLYYDYKLLDEIPGGVEVKRSESFDPFRILHLVKSLFLKRTPQFLSSPPRLYIQKMYFFLFIPDSRIGWLPYALSMGLKMIKTFSPKIIFATAPPYTALLVGALLKKITKIPFVADLRDQWVDNPFNPTPTRLHRLFNRKLEEFVVKEADKVIVVAEGVRDDLKERYSLKDEKLTIIPQGYDEEDFTDMELESFDKFTIVYTGTFYGKANSPHNFFRALKKIFEERPELEDKIQFVLVGRCAPSIVKFIREIGIEKNVILKGVLPHKDSIRVMLSADALLFLFDQVEGTERKFISGKTFEYLASSKPILAIVPPKGLAAECIKKAGTGIVVSPDDIEKIKESILTLYEGRFKFIPDTEFIKKFSRKNLTRILEREMLSVMERRTKC